MDEKQIVLKPNSPPEFIGDWKIGEVQQMAKGLLMWLDSLPLNIQEKVDDAAKVSE